MGGYSASVSIGERISLSALPAAAINCPLLRQRYIREYHTPPRGKGHRLLLSASPLSGAECAEYIHGSNPQGESTAIYSFSANIFGARVCNCAGAGEGTQ